MSVLETIRREFLQVLDEAQPASKPPPGFFDDLAERIIQSRLRRMWTPRKLPFGGAKEADMAQAMERAAEPTFKNKEAWPFAGRAMLLARLFRQTEGSLYTRKMDKRVSPSVLQQMREEMEGLQAQLRSEVGRALPEAEKRWKRDRLMFLEEFVERGYPEPVGNFRVEPRYFMICVGGAKKIRLVDVINANQVRYPMVEITAKDLAQPSVFREWASNVGLITSKMGTNELDLFKEDMDLELDGCEVYELAHYGWHEFAKIWLVGDCMVEESREAAKPSLIIPPDEQGIYWVNGMGYRMRRVGDVLLDSEGQKFKVDPPRWHPGEGLRFKGGRSKIEDGGSKRERKNEDRGSKMEDRKANPSSTLHSPSSPLPSSLLHSPSSPLAPRELELGPGEDDPAALAYLFHELCWHLKEAISGVEASYEAYLVIGNVFSYLLAPEFFGRHRQFSGCWMNGEAQSGKNTTARWALRLLGFESDKGVNFGGTYPGLSVAHNQLCNLPVWIDEANKLEGPDVEFLKSLGDRIPLPKFGVQREILTTPLITAEHTSSDSALRSRFVHVLISANRRVDAAGATINHFDWFDKHQRFFFALAGIWCGGGRGMWSGRWRCTGSGWSCRSWTGRRSGGRRRMGSVTRPSRRRRSCWGEAKSEKWEARSEMARREPLTP